MKRVILVTGHYFESKRKAGFHWLAEAYWKAGWEVIYFTAPISWLSWLRRDHRFNYPIFQEANKIKWVREGLASYLWFTPLHPINFRSELLNNLSYKLFSNYGNQYLGDIETYIQNSNLFIFESNAVLLLFTKFKKLNNKARYVYRVSDDLRFSNPHQLVVEAEERFSSQFDLVSVPSEYIYQKFSHLKNSALHRHAIEKSLFEQNHINPYTERSTNLVFIGNSYLDYEFIRIASLCFKDWKFHIIGPFEKKIQHSNVIFYGEVPFVQTLPYVKFADIGLHTLCYRPGAESFTDSLKVIQYTYCQLPIVAPEFLRSSKSHVFYYKPNDTKSITKSLENAVKYNRSKINTNSVYSWSELATILKSPSIL